MGSVHAPAQGPTVGTLLDVSNGTFAAFQHKDGSAMQALTTADFTYIGKEGVLSGRELAEATKTCTLRSFSLSKPKMKLLSANTAVLAYVAHQEESCDGNPTAPVLLNQDVFVRRAGKWLVSTHMEVEIPDHD
jgi:hypothetical protein